MSKNRESGLFLQELFLIKEPESLSADVRLGLVDLFASESKEVLSEYFGEGEKTVSRKGRR